MKKIFKLNTKLNAKRYTLNPYLGFTLIELMIVMVIIAILITIGLSVYSGAQKSARDAIRRSQVDQFAKALEASRNPATGVYTYSVTSTTPITSADFPDGLADPSAQAYCINLNTSASPPATCDTAWTAAANTCPGACVGVGYITLTAALKTSATNLDLLPTDGQVKGWTLCASLEGSSSTFCKKSVAR